MLSSVYNLVTNKPSNKQVDNFIIACKRGDADLVNKYIKKFGNKIINVSYCDGETALIWASFTGSLKVVKALTPTRDFMISKLQCRPH